MNAARRPRVLVLEDEWMIAEQIEAALTDGGFEVVGPVGRIDQAMALIGEAGIDAAVLDINLHGDRSFEVAEALARAGTPLAFLSGYSPAELPPAFRGRPLLTKPLDIQNLHRILNDLISKAP